MPQFNTQLAFGLTDHPFSPTKLLPGMTDIDLISPVSTYPLRMHLDEHLDDLFCYDAGPFRKHLDDFENLIGVYGYVAGVSAGAMRFPFVVTGARGTGKTTLVNRMMYHVKKCRPPGTPADLWKIFEPWGERILSVEEQLAEISKLKTSIVQDTSPGDCCCVVLDKLVSGVETAAINLYEEIRQRCIVFLFLITSDDRLMYETLSDGRKVPRSWENYGPGFTVYQTEELTPVHAVQYVTHRIGVYRCKDDHNDPLFPQFPLFPFDADDLTAALQKQDGVGLSILNLRQLNQHLSKAIRDEMKSMPGSYDIRTLPPAQLSDEIIPLAQQSYQRMLPERKAA